MIYCILAAGNGSRLKADGIDLPKPLVPLEGKPMIGRLMDLMVDCDAQKIVVITNREMPETVEFLNKYKSESKIPVEFIVQSTPSSLHSFYALSPLIDGDKFIMTTVDTVFKPQDMKRYVEAFNASDADAFMAVTEYIDDEKPLYVETDGDMNVTAFADTRPQDARFISGGIYGLTRGAIDVAKECLDSGQSRMRNFQRTLVSSGKKVKAWNFGKIFDVDHADDLKKANLFCQ